MKKLSIKIIIVLVSLGTIFSSCGKEKIVNIPMTTPLILTSDSLNQDFSHDQIVLGFIEKWLEIKHRNVELDVLLNSIMMKVFQKMK